MADEIEPRERGLGPHCDREAEPARVAARSRTREDQKLFPRPYAIVEPLPVLLAGGNEMWQFFELGDAERRLHVGCLEVVADVGVDVFVVVSGGQFAELPIESL